MLVSTNLGPLFQKGISKQFFLGLKEYNPPWKNIFHVGTTDERYIWHQGWEGYPKPVFRVPGEPITQASMAPTFNKQYIIRRFGLGDSFPQEDIDEDLYAVINWSAAKKGGLLARSFIDLMEYETAGFFTNQGFATGTNVFGMSDGRSLFNTAHPVSVRNSTITAANRPSVDADLSVTSAQAAQVNLRTQYAPNNLTIINGEPRAVVFHPSLLYVAKQVYRGQWTPGTADRNLNYTPEDDTELISWPYFQSSGATGTNNSWFEIGKEHYLHFFMHTTATPNTDYDINTNSQIIMWTTAFDYGADDWRQTYGSLGL
jgi:hypothetical protein